MAAQQSSYFLKYFEGEAFVISPNYVLIMSKLIGFTSPALFLINNLYVSN